MNQQEKVVAALRLAMDCIEDAARIAGPMGAPSGTVYAALIAHGMTLDVYQQIVDVMVNMGKIKVKGHLIFLA
jgi:hypothetical protein